MFSIGSAFSDGVFRMIHDECRNIGQNEFV